MSASEEISNVYMKVLKRSIVNDRRFQMFRVRDTPYIYIYIIMDVTTVNTVTTVNPHSKVIIVEGKHKNIVEANFLPTKYLSLKLDPSNCFQTHSLEVSKGQEDIKLIILNQVYVNPTQIHQK